MKRIVFVDDEPRVLEGLQRMLRGERHRWQMSFAVGGPAALETLAKDSFDVIVTDMRMPGMDGAMLLKKVQEDYPGIVRIVLSGYFEDHAAMRAAEVAHQFLLKPCDPQRLIQTVERACCLAAIITQESARKLVSAVGDLPCVPSTYASLVQELEKPESSLHQVAKIVEKDVGLAAKTLQLVNSAFFGLVREITTVDAAVGYLGLDVLKQLVLSVEVFRAFNPSRPTAGFSIENLQSHSLLTSAIASSLPVSKSQCSSAVVAGLLHDAGKLVLAAKLPEQFELAFQQAIQDGSPLWAAEERVAGASHAAIGAYLLGLWGLPAAVVEAVHLHHTPEAPLADHGPMDTTVAVHIADALAHEVRGEQGAQLNIELLDAMGLADQLPEWRETAIQAALKQRPA